MTDKTTEEKAKKSAITYAKAWGGMSPIPVPETLYHSTTLSTTSISQKLPSTDFPPQTLPKFPTPPSPQDHLKPLTNTPHLRKPHPPHPPRHPNNRPVPPAPPIPPPPLPPRPPPLHLPKPLQLQNRRRGNLSRLVRLIPPPSTATETEFGE